jgi:hypothetical protein
MRLFGTYPFTSPNDPTQSNYLTEVVRIDELSGGKRGIAIHLRTAYPQSVKPVVVNQVLQ